VKKYHAKVTQLLNTRYHGVELGQVSCGKQTFGRGI